MANVPFDPVVYKLIKVNYTDNIRVLGSLGPGQKIGFDGNTGKFSIQTNRQRGNLAADSKQSAKDADTFVFPVTALMYEACRNCIKPRIADQDDHSNNSYKSRSAQEFKNDLSILETSLVTLLATYSGTWQFFKGDQKGNIRILQETASAFKAIVELNEDWNDKYSKLNLEFARKTSFKSSPGVHNIFVIAFNDPEIIKHLNEFTIPLIQKLGIEETIRTATDGIQYNMEYFALVKKLSDLIYKKCYSGGTKNNDTVDNFIRYLEGLKKVSIGVQKIEFQKHQEIEFDQSNNFKQVKNMVVAIEKGTPVEKRTENVSDKELVFENNNNNFIWFRFVGDSGLPTTCRVYLNIKPLPESHKAVIQQLCKIKSGEYGPLIQCFKIVSYIDSRADAVCVYCLNYTGAKVIAQELYKDEFITPWVRRSVANTQKQQYPGIGIGVEPTTNVKSADGKYIRIEQDNEGLPEIINDNLIKYQYIGNWHSQWSFGTHRSFLTAWAIIRTIKSKRNVSQADFQLECMNQAEQIFANDGLDFMRPHKINGSLSDKKHIAKILWDQA